MDEEHHVYQDGIDCSFDSKMANPGSNNVLPCPFCDVADSNSEFLLQHINLLHPEDENASYLIPDGKEVPLSGARSSYHVEGASDEWIECACGELCPLADFSMHLDLHEAENFSDIESSTAAVTQPASPSQYSFPSVDVGGIEAMDDAHSKRVALPLPISLQASSYHDPLVIGASTAQPSVELQQTLQNIYSEDNKLTAMPIAKRLGVGKTASSFMDATVLTAIDRKQSSAPSTMKSVCQLQSGR